MLRLESALRHCDPSFFDRVPVFDEKDLRLHLTNVIRRDFNPAKLMQRLSHPITQQTLSTNLKLLKPPVISISFPPSAFSIRQPATAKAIELKATKAGSLEQTLLWLEFTILVLDPERDPGPSNIQKRLDIISNLLFFNSSSPYNPFMQPTS